MKTEKTFKVEGVEFTLFVSEKEITSNEVVSEMGDRGYRPSTEDELRLLGKHHPELGLPIVVALGTIHSLGGQGVVVGLDHCSGNIDNIGRFYYGGRWGQVFFAGVRK